ncbi:unnamed protein product [Candida verbasci]|uniref:Uncharacterized protein n=1 Tax=Candida verbasci TaxID=1227364 RepID=A0A9W4TPN0_9ASCO|nr:unnamed protein product [Candida verbasci]
MHVLLLFCFIIVHFRFIIAIDTAYYQYIDLTTNSTTSVLSDEPKVYALNSIDEISSHIDKLKDKSSIFFFKLTQSTLQYNHKYHKWTEILKTNPLDTLKIRPYDYWLPATHCLDSKDGNGGYLRRDIYIEVELSIENYIDLHFGFIPIGFSVGVNLAMGVRVGYGMLLILTFNCDLYENEIVQLVYKPNYMTIPPLTFIEYKLRKRRLEKGKVKLITPFRMLVIDAPQHKCLRSNQPSDLMCSIKQDIKKQKIFLH